MVMIRSPSLEKRDASYQGREPVRVIDAVSRYKPWARHWSQRARLGDHTLEIIIAAIIDERAFHIIKADAGIRHGMAARVTIAGLRDAGAHSRLRPDPPTCAVQKVGSHLRYTGRGANAFGKASGDPQETSPALSEPDIMALITPVLQGSI